MAFWVYILRCGDGSYYTGQTDDLECRISQHHTGEFGGYTATRKPLELIFHQDFVTREEAREAETQIKGWSRRKKEALMRGDWESITRFARVRAK
jgi:predicted GIY-YIG superfamily endonuclease